MILSVYAAIITINDDSCYFIVNIFRRGGSSKLLLYCWCAALFSCAESGVCCRDEQTVKFFSPSTVLIREN